MNTKKFLATLAVLAMVVVSLAPAAMAGTTDNTVTTVNLAGGALSLDAVPTGFAFSGLTVSNTSQNTATSNSADNVTVEDLRNDSSGFSLTAAATDFDGGSGNDTFADDNMKIRTEPSTTTTNSGAALVGAAVPVDHASNYTSIADATAIWTNTGAQEAGDWSLEVDFQVVVPAFTPAGTYTSTVTFSVS